MNLWVVGVTSNVGGWDKNVQCWHAHVRSLVVLTKVCIARKFNLAKFIDASLVFWIIQNTVFSQCRGSSTVLTFLSDSYCQSSSFSFSLGWPSTLLVSLLISFWSSSSEPQSAFQVWDHLTIDGAQYFGSSRILFSAPTFSHFVNSTIYLSCKSSNLFLAFIFVWHHLRIVIVGFTEDTSSPGKHARRELGLSVSFVVFRGSLLQSTKRTIKVSRCTQRICQ